MPVVVLAGMIALGKSSMAELLGDKLGYKVFYESVEDNPILPLFYTASAEEIQAKRYPFLLQLHFLDTRFRAIKKALIDGNNILDRSIYEDWYFAKKNMELGRMSTMEFEIYEKLLRNMMDETKELPKKAPDVLIYLRGSFETVMNRIQTRGRRFELSEELRDYYHYLWKDYDNWLYNDYKSSPVVVVDMDNLDFVNNEEDAAVVIKAIGHILDELNHQSSTKDIIKSGIVLTISK